MQYVSPIHTLGLENTEILDKESLKMAKKKLLAEVELSTMGTILRGGNEMTKDDILKAFDTITDTDDWDKHILIAQDKALLSFLENNDFALDSSFFNKKEYKNDSFIAFISPCFLTSYKKVLFNCLKNKDVLLLKKLKYETPNLLTEWHKEQLNSEIDNWLRLQIEEIESKGEALDAGAYISKKEIDDLYPEDLMHCFNVLGSDFLYLRNNIAIALCRLSVSFWNRFFKDKARIVLMKAHKLECDAEVVKVLKEHDAYFFNDGTFVDVYFKLYYMSYFDQQPHGILLWLAWIPKIIASPVVEIWKMWDKLMDYIQKYILVQFIQPIGNFVLAIGTMLYSVCIILAFYALLLLSIIND